MPRPACALSDFWCTCEKRSKIFGTRALRNPHPRVLHLDHRVRVLLRDRQRDATARLHELRGVVQDVPDDLHQAGRIAVDAEQILRQVERERVAAGVDQRTSGLDSSGDDGIDQHPLPLQRNHPPRDARHVEQVVDETHQMLHLPLDDLARAHGLCLGQVPFPQQLNSRANGRQRIPELVSQNRQELVLVTVRFLESRGRCFERGGPVGHPPLEFGIETLERACLAIQLGEDTDLRTQDLGNHGNRHVVHRPALVSTQPIQVGQQQRGHENDRGALKARMLPDHRGQFVAIELRHDHVHEDHGHVVAQQVFERFGRRAHLDEGFPELAEDRLVREQFRRLVVHQKDVDRVDARDNAHEPVPLAYRWSHRRSADSSCSVLTGFAR